MAVSATNWKASSKVSIAYASIGLKCMLYRGKYTNKNITSPEKKSDATAS